MDEADDLFSPGTGGSGYGSRTLFGPEGAIALNNKDTVIAGTNLFQKGDDVVSSGEGEIQLPSFPTAEEIATAASNITQVIDVGERNLGELSGQAATLFNSTPLSVA